MDNSRQNRAIVDFKPMIFSLVNAQAENDLRAVDGSQFGKT
jgi:hypothetical protein